MTDTDLLESTPSGLYCPAGDFYVDPWRPVTRAVITHGHSDHARQGSRYYLAADDGKTVLRMRLGKEARIQSLPYGTPLTVNGVNVSFYPAGHILGSAQVRIEYRGQVWVVSGDFKNEPDSTCRSFEPVQCHTFVTESTFGLPVFRWEPQESIFSDINSWWQKNRESGRVSVLYAYALGKAQRVIAGLDPSLGSILTHGAVERVNQCYRGAGIDLPATRYLGVNRDPEKLAGSIIVAPPSADSTQWLRRLPDCARAFASGWMRIRGNRRRRAVDRGFVLSDHADWEGLIHTIRATGAYDIRVTHGYVEEMVRWLKASGWDARPVSTPFSGEVDGSDDLRQEASAE